MRSTSLVLFASLTLLCACGERTLIRHYYILELPDSTGIQTAMAAPIEGTCEILSTTMPPAFNQDRIVVRRRSHEIDYYQHNYWAMNPAENITAILEQKLQQANIFEYSSSGNLRAIPEYQLISDVSKLEVIEQEDIYFTRLEMRIELIGYAHRELLSEHHFDRLEQLERRDLNLFAAKISRILDEETDIFLEKTRVQLKITADQNP